MNNIKLLDCTLRDGGYVNNWEFGLLTIKRILGNLYASGIEIIECGFLTNKVKYTMDSTLFTEIHQMNDFVERRDGIINVCMINYGEYRIEDIPNAGCGISIDGIRVAFHKKDWKDAISFCELLNAKGYKVFVQPMVTIMYSDIELLELVHSANKICSYAFYIVDSFGVMKQNDLLRMFYLVNNNLNKGINIGYHSHNNLQLSFSNSQELLNNRTDREIIIDASVFGMGRGAGNLNIELFMMYLNNNYGKSYSTNPILRIIDESLANIYKKSFWGYSLPHYLSAVNNCHPNYASYLTDKNTLNIESINEILTSVADEKKIGYDKNYIEELYISYQNKQLFHQDSTDELRSLLNNRNIVVVAPGSSIHKSADIINKLITIEDAICITVNFIDDVIKSDVVFFSNIKRAEQYNDLDLDINTKVIVTSNIDFIKGYVVSYNELLQDDDIIVDNSSLMLIKLLLKLNVRSIFIAGMDGYVTTENYINKEMEIPIDIELFERKNRSISKQLRRYENDIEIKFITSSIYE